MALLPSTRLQPCPACAELAYVGAGRCPHCGEKMSERTGLLCTAALLWTGLSLSGCVVTAVYGVPTTSDSGTGTTTGPATESGTDTDTTTGGTGTGTGSTTGPTTGTSGTTGTTADPTGTTTTGTTDTGATTTGSTTETTGMTGTSTDQPLYGAVEPARED